MDQPPLMWNNASHIPQTKRIYCREWRMQHRVIRATVSLPRLQLVKADRPIFECPVCYSCNDRLPICFWCKSTSPESAAAFWCSMPKQRTISAPVHMTYWSCANNSTKSISIATPVSTAVGAGKAQETVSRVLYNQPCQKSFVPPPSNSSCRTDRAALPHSALLRRRSSYNSTTTTCTTSSETTTPETTPDSIPHRRVDDLGRITLINNNNSNSNSHSIDIDILQDHHHHDRRYHSLPLRRKGNLLRTTAGMIVKKTRLSALFRKDAVPVLDTTMETPSHVHHHPHPRREKLKIRTEPVYHSSSSSSAKHNRRMAVVLPTIPDSSIPPPAVPLSSYSSGPPGVSTSSDRRSDYYTMPTPPSFLSPFWYRPDQYGNLPSSPSTSSSGKQTSAASGMRPSHSHTLSEPFPTFPRQQQRQPESPRKWRTRVGGLFRTSINVVSGRHSR